MKNTAPIALVFSVLLSAAALLAMGQEKAASAPATASASAPATGPATAAAAAPGEVTGGEWKSADGVVTQSNGDTPALLLFGDKAWKDYTLELEGQKTGGDEGFLIAVRAKDADHLVWFNVGGWGNTRTAFEGLTDEGKSDFGDGQTYAPFVEVQNDKWHKLKVTVSGNKIEGFIDGKSACKATAEALPAGRIGIGTWSTEAKFRNIKVTAPDGKVLWEGSPRVGK